MLRLTEGTYLEKDGPVPAEPDGQAANGDDDALLPLPQLLAHRLPSHVQVSVLGPQGTPSSHGKGRKETRERERHMKVVHVKTVAFTCSDPLVTTSWVRSRNMRELRA